MAAPISRRSWLALAGAGVVSAGCGGTDTGSPTSSASRSASASTSTAGTPSASATRSPSSSPSTAGTPKGTARVTGTVTTGIDVPWGTARMPDGSVLVTSRDAHRVYRLDLASGRRTDLGQVPGVASDPDGGGEGGLLGIAVSPRFGTDRRVYLYLSTDADNRIGWVRYAGGRIGRPTVILDGIPHSTHHNGGGLRFGPDGLLYAGTGEAEDEPLAQDKGSLGGKVLRMTREGKPAPGNPFSGSVVWSYGHRNVQGLAFDPDGRLWASEFGDQDLDELNWVRPGRNYGWPATQGRTDDRRYTSPVAQWGTDEDSPSGVAYAAGCIWMAALQGERLWRIPLDGTKAVAEPAEFLRGRYGRLRSVLALDDQTLLLGTSNRDGRATPKNGDDRLLRVAVT